MPSRSSNTVKVWTCCQCGDSGMTTRVDSCPSCYYHHRCDNCVTQKVRVRGG
ncbi:hypothetical protein CDEST_14606 [Colletotrichum destructivum]|uniref:Uncharacterized protein n=1 Tax=Colletotrichum destructivum TaxID=34406 RepID=A0AAX4J2F3_9PEZI|nr:hypothetical protein CDEST_14606 [Colletotrichum destructivum]